MGMDTKALQLGSRFVLGPNQLGYCGRGSAPEKLKNCIGLGKCGGVEEEFSKFIVFYPYLKTLSEIAGLDRYSYPVIEAYWLGNDQLRKAKNKHYGNLLKHFKEQGVPDWLVEELKIKKPKVFIPFHLFQILHVGVGRASSAVPLNLDSINNCMVKWGTTVKVNPEKSATRFFRVNSPPSSFDLHSGLRRVNNSKQVVVRLKVLEKSKNGRCKLKESEVVADYSPKLMGELELGATVAVHWGMVAKKLTEKEVENLSYWTEKVLETVEPVI